VCTVVLVATIGFGLLQLRLADLQHAQDQANALDQQRAGILQAYLDNVQDLLLNHQLATHPTIEVQELARALTLATVKNLDPVRKGI
jgi:hypothetical protein